MEQSQTPERKSVVVLGSVSSVARAAAAAFAQHGYVVILGDPDAEENAIIADDLRTRFSVTVHAMPFDALAFDTHAAFVEECTSRLGRLPDGVLACFGFMTDQASTQTDFALTQLTINLNFTGMVSILNLFANAFELRKSGFIAAISSVAGDRGRKTNYTYGAAKAGLTAYLSGLRNRLHGSGVRVTTIKPGFIDTKMTYGMPLPKPLVASPEQAGQAIYRAIERRKNTVYIRWFWRYIMLIIRHIPEFQFKKMSI